MGLREKRRVDRNGGGDTFGAFSFKACRRQKKTPAEGGKKRKGEIKRGINVGIFTYVARRTPSLEKRKKGQRGQKERESCEVAITCVSA